MSIGYTLLLENKKLTEEILIKKIKSMGYSYDNIEHQSEQIMIDLNKELGLSLCLFNAKNYPYNSWETDFLEKEYLYEQVLDIRLDKEYLELKKRYNFVLEVIFDLMQILKINALLLSNGDTELCFFNKDFSILLNNETGIWDRECFSNIIANKNILNRII